MADDSPAEPLLSDRLLAMLREEIAALEAASPAMRGEADGCAMGEADAMGSGQGEDTGDTAAAHKAKAGGRALAKGSAKAASGAGNVACVGSKGRIDAIGQVTRILEKLLELKRLETLAFQPGGAEDEAEAERLRAEMMKRLRALDARRLAGAGLFAQDSGGAPLADAPDG